MIGDSGMYGTPSGFGARVEAHSQHGNGIILRAHKNTVTLASMAI